MHYSETNISHKKFIETFYESINSNPTIKSFLSLISEASNGDFYIFGGALRRTLLGGQLNCDIDIMVENGDDRVFDHLKENGIKFNINRRKHRRYQWCGFQFDINQPSEWEPNFKNVSDVLLHFYLNINSLALHHRHKSIIDPYNLIKNQSFSDPGINWDRWDSSSDFEVTILAIRLNRILHENPKLSLRELDVDRLMKTVLPKCEHVKWKQLKNRYNNGQKDFLSEFVELINKKKSK